MLADEITNQAYIVYLHSIFMHFWLHTRVIPSEERRYTKTTYSKEQLQRGFEVCSTKYCFQSNRVCCTLQPIQDLVLADITALDATDAIYIYHNPTVINHFQIVIDCDI